MSIQEDNTKLTKNDRAYKNKIATLQQNVSILQQNCEIHQNNTTTYKNRYNTANNYLIQYQDHLSKLQADYNIISEKHKVSENERKKLEVSYQKEKEDADYYYSLFQSLEHKTKKLRESYIKKLEKKVVGPNADFKHLINFTVEKLDSLLVWPISFDKLDKPVILPSGNSVSREIMESFIERKRTDPFDRTKACKSLISNLLVQNIMETLQEVEQKKSEIEQTKMPVSQGTQTDIIVRWEKDIQEIENLKEELVVVKNLWEGRNQTIKNLEAKIGEYIKTRDYNLARIHLLTKSVAYIESKKTQLHAHGFETVQFFESKLNQMGSPHLSKGFETLAAFISKTDNWIIQMRGLQIWEQMMHRLLFILYKKPKVDITKSYSDRRCQAIPQCTTRAVGIGQPKAFSVAIGTNNPKQVTSATQHEEAANPGILRKFKGFFFG